MPVGRSVPEATIEKITALAGETQQPFVWSERLENFAEEPWSTTTFAMGQRLFSRISSGTSARKMSGISPDVTHFFNIYYPGAVEGAGAPLTAQTALSNGNGAPSAPTEKA